MEKGEPWHTFDERDQRALEAKLTVKFQDIKERHRFNQKIGLLALVTEVFLIAVIVATAQVVNSVLTLSYLGTFALVLGIFPAPYAFVRFLRIITVEERALQHLGNSRTLLEGYDSKSSDKSPLKKAIKSLRKAADEIGSTDKESALWEDYRKTRNGVADALDKKLAYRLEKAEGNGDVEEVRERLNGFVVFLMSANLDSAKDLLLNTAGLPPKEKEPRRGIQWQNLPERRLGQVAIATVATFIVEIVAYVAAVELQLNPLDFFKTNLGVVLFVGVTAFFGVLTWLSRK